jgi:broad specificity phosphatase PhoE
MMQTHFLFLRHAESEKNIIDTIGGKGKKLTPTGVQHAEMVARRLSRVIRECECSVISSPAIQAVETASIISKHINCPVTISNALVPAGMGVVSGLNASQIREQFPEIAEALQKWRSREIEACDLVIPGKEPPEDFWNRMKDFLHAHDTGGVKMIITTRSIMVFVKNLLLNNLPYKGGGYKHMDVGHCEIVSFILDDGAYISFPIEE